MTVEILAEPGSTHEGRTEWMLDLIDLAKAAGCDAIKWQLLSSATRLCHRRRALSYLEAYQLIEGTPTLWAWLVKETHARGLRALATVYIPEDAQPIADAGVDAIKIASFEANDGNLLLDASRTGLPLYISTGMMTQAEVDTLLTRVQPAVLFHCVSSYPSPPDALNLRVLTQWDRTFHHARLGFSDHSGTWLAGGIAVAAGATVLEIHYRHADTPITNADYATALDGDQLRRYVDCVRLTERMLGDGVKAPHAAEANMLQYRARP